jgi:hypothetical protein
MLLIGLYTHEHAMLPLPFMSGCMNHPRVYMLWRGLYIFSEGFVRGIYVGWVGVGGDCVGKCVCYVGLLIFCKIFHH